MKTSGKSNGVLQNNNGLNLIKVNFEGELVMGNPVNLTEEQKLLKDRLYVLNQKLWKFLKDRTNPMDYEAMQPLYQEMAKTAMNYTCH